MDRSCYSNFRPNLRFSPNLHKLKPPLLELIDFGNSSFKANGHDQVFRRPFREHLEGRLTLAAGVGAQNPIQPADTNYDAFVSPIDALIVIDELNPNRGGPIGEPTRRGFLDTNGDGFTGSCGRALFLYRLWATSF